MYQRMRTMTRVKVKLGIYRANGYEAVVVGVRSLLMASEEEGRRGWRDFSITSRPYR